ncbi:MAG: carbamoyltransferase HypF, partial [Coriobacteriales bacterium]|nr:carbamoyltransferase HypF [Coriobacteriales bacterium]
FISRCAHSLGIIGEVKNTTKGVEILAKAENATIRKFCKTIKADCPKRAKIYQMQIVECDCKFAQNGFIITKSENDSVKSTLISPDIATCKDCLSELFNETNKRYHYPFINCTNCGPRFTIIKDLPYDRQNTIMNEFKMCNSCKQDYDEIRNRRFHAQPNACFECGPALFWNPSSKIQNSLYARDISQSDEIIKACANAIKDGKIVAIKALGGWNLAVDARNAQAVDEIRTRKNRPHKPLAVMMGSLDTAKKYCDLSQAEINALHSPYKPIVLANLRKVDPKATKEIAKNVVCGLYKLGVMLPNTPVQHLLFEHIDFPVVMTSANVSGNPIIFDEEKDMKELQRLSDCQLGNNRQIIAGYDDSVVQVMCDNSLQIIRRARGLAPAPLSDENIKEQIFASGPQQKGNFCLAKDGLAFVSQHLGQLNTIDSINNFEQAFYRYADLFDVEPNVVACDLHPEYESTKFAKKYAQDKNLRIIVVQHHHAHISSVIGENKLNEQVLGLAIDGTGLGSNNNIWGCELMECTKASFKRLWNLPSFMLLGGESAIKNPEKIGFALLKKYNKDKSDEYTNFINNIDGLAMLEHMYNHDLNAFRCSSLGRLFDGYAAILGLVKDVTYEAQAASLLEAAAINGNKKAYNFHKKIASLLVEKCIEASNKTGIKKLCISGGCLQNQLLYKLLLSEISKTDLELFLNIDLPCNDGNISYGQTVVASAILNSQNN